MFNVLNLLTILIQFHSLQEVKIEEPVITTLIEESVPKEVKDTIYLGVYKVTTYTTVNIEARHYKDEKFCISFKVNNRGKDIQLWIPKKKTNLDVEGFARVSTEKSNLVVDHNCNVQKFVKNSRGKKLTEGQVACNSLKYGTKLLIKGKEYTVTDVGSGLSDNQIDVYTENYRNKTEFLEIKKIN